MIDAVSTPALAITGGASLPVPGPYWLFTVLHWLTFSLHLVAMNILFGGILILLLARSSPVRTRMFETFTGTFPTVMAATITLGVAPLLFVQVIYGEFFYAASIVSAWNWWLIVPVVLAAYYLLYAVALKKSLTQKAKLLLLAVAAAGFVYVSYTFTIISDLAEKPSLWAGLYQSSPGGMSVNPSFVETIFRWLHTIAGALAVAGVSIMFFALYHPKGKDNRDPLTFGGRIYMLGIIKAAVFGVIYIFTLDRPIFDAFLRSPGLHAILGAIVMNMFAVYVLYRALRENRPHWKIWTSAALVFAGVFCMVIARHALRLIYLEGHFDPSALVISEQWSVFAMFLIVFLVGLAALYWMLRKFFTSRIPAQKNIEYQDFL